MFYLGLLVGGSIGIILGALLTVAMCLMVMAGRESERERRVLAGGSGPQDGNK